MKLRALLPMMAALSACTTLQNVQPQTYLESHNPEHVRIYTGRGQLTVLEAPRLNGSVISGFDRIERQNTKIDLSSIERMEVKTLNRNRTTLLIGGAAALTGLGAYFISKQNGGRALVCDSYTVDSRCYLPAMSRRVPLGFKLSL